MSFRPSLTENDIALLKRRTLVRIVDDDAELRDALQFLLEVEGWRVAAYGRAEDFLTSDAPSVPGCVVLHVPFGRAVGETVAVGERHAFARLQKQALGFDRASGLPKPFRLRRTSAARRSAPAP